jgi:hypothetical protein
MFYITGMMGPYTAPMAFNVPGRHADVTAGGLHRHALGHLPSAQRASAARATRKIQSDSVLWRL